MNIYGLIILVALLGSFLLDLISELLNLRALKSEVPAEFVDVYQAADYKKSQEYTRVKTRFGLLTGTFSLAVTLIFWFMGGFNLLDLWVRAFGFSLLGTGLAYIGILVLAKQLLGLPFTIYSTFVVEERFGFNRTTVATFIQDFIKGLILSLVLGGPILTAILLFFQKTGQLAWLYCWLLSSGFVIFMHFIAPTWIMPLFNKFTPLEEGELKKAIMDYARSVDFSLQNIMVMDGSRRTSKANAFFAGFGKNRRIALFDTLIGAQTIGELVAILAHEIGHYRKKHIIQGLLISILHMGGMFFLLSVFISHQGLFDAFYMASNSIYSGLIFFGLLYTPVEMVLSVVMQIISRRNEYEADRFAAETTGAPEQLISALKKLSKDNLSNLTPAPLYVFLNYSHPPVLKRIWALRQPHQ